ncbi:MULTISPECIES: hypothetical protein [Rhodococcus]|jgi:hypothetical protein|uniref:hypothetical protein n=1 Tax=Rhodococcus TaxID=1827 RepID=UPI00120F9B06|nr:MULTISPECIES: hypothetical protein [Rhodococcus]MCE4266429.1 hypothetical protein [Rhodococcus globerulus]RZL26127.1 MAG: DUF3263 domain-containing protein [Rhodococcus sp. (in: high G+C Gram-positive bacteria)]
MNDHDAILTFALKWRHWNGGPAEDIFVQFGITPDQFFRRLHSILEVEEQSDLSPEIAAELAYICDLRLNPVELRLAG